MFDDHKCKISRSQPQNPVNLASIWERCRQNSLSNLSLFILQLFILHSWVRITYFLSILIVINSVSSSLLFIVPKSSTFSIYTNQPSAFSNTRQNSYITFQYKWNKPWAGYRWSRYVVSFIWSLYECEGKTFRTNNINVFLIRSSWICRPFGKSDLIQGVRFKVTGSMIPVWTGTVPNWKKVMIKASWSHWHASSFSLYFILSQSCQVIACLDMWKIQLRVVITSSGILYLHMFWTLWVHSCFLGRIF